MKLRGEDRDRGREGGRDTERNTGTARNRGRQSKIQQEEISMMNFNIAVGKEKEIRKEEKTQSPFNSTKEAKRNLIGVLAATFSADLIGERLSHHVAELQNRVDRGRFVSGNSTVQLELHRVCEELDHEHVRLDCHRRVPHDARRSAAAAARFNVRDCSTVQALERHRRGTVLVTFA